MPVDETQSWFDAVPEKQRAILVELRKLILSAAPGIVEEFKWSRPCYSTAKGMFCYLQRTKNHVSLGFQKGAALKDPKKLLEGEGKDMRHITFAEAVKDQAARLQLVKQAAKLG